jgi:lipopolysaccharide/colanic/teichoic acid biosynthesis glycosyltransferase
VRNFDTEELSNVLKSLENAYRERTNYAVPAADAPALHRAGCFPEIDGLYHFPRPDFSRVAVCGRCERAIAFLLILAVSPVLLLVALAILLCDGAPVLFRQERTGLDNRPFTVLKFRTMVGSSRRQRESLARQAPADRTFKLGDDPRVTRLGAFLRTHFLDELPQLWNIARGEMRLFGPRPLPASDHGLYQRPGQSLRLLGLPGLSGIWQTVRDRNELTFDEMCLLDYYGLCHDSFRLQLRLLWKTIALLF